MSDAAPQLPDTPGLRTALAIARADGARAERSRIAEQLDALAVELFAQVECCRVGGDYSSAADLLAQWRGVAAALEVVKGRMAMEAGKATP